MGSKQSESIASAFSSRVRDVEFLFVLHRPDLRGGGGEIPSNKGITLAIFPFVFAARLTFSGI